jgi:SAM-dependent methyltransferase
LEFVDYSALCLAPVVDIGCAYGVVSRAALEKGAQQVIANDIEPKHLQILLQSVSGSSLAERLVLRPGRFPSDLEFEPNTIGAVFISRVLHFFDGPTIQQCLKAIHKWLIPGKGKLFIVAETPQQRKSFLPLYKERKEKEKEEWPGCLSSGVKGTVGGGIIHFLDKDILKRELKNAGFKIERTQYFARHTIGVEAACKEDSIGVVAVKKRKKKKSK